LGDAIGICALGLVVAFDAVLLIQTRVLPDVFDVDDGSRC
jgi:hypothetical protein